MKIMDKMESGVSALKVAFLKRKIPLAVRLQLTNRCDNRCLYCKVWDTKSEEHTTEEVFSLLHELKEMGTKTISLSGGEPLLREDIGRIIDCCRSLNISVGMNSRGALMDKKIGELKNLDQIKISIDGPEDVHDLHTRKTGAYRQSIKAVEVALAHGMQVILTTTITKYNVDHLEFVLDLAEKYHVLAAFQPLKRLARGVEDMDELYPDVEKYKKAIERLILLKKNGNKQMRNSLVGLKHIRHWPNYNGRIPCAAGKIFCIIETNGDVYPCDRIRYPEKPPNCRELGFKRAFDMLPPVHCDGCGFCGTLELNLLLSFRPDIVSTIWKVFK